VGILRRFGIDLAKQGGVPIEAFQAWDSEGNVIGTTQFHVKERPGEEPV
jgi:hypothetical protein